MKIHIKSTNFTLTPDVSDYLQKKMDMLDRLIDQNDTSVLCDVEVGKTSKHHKSGDVFRTEINFRKDGKQFRTVAEETSILAAIDEAKDQVVSELKNYKSKQQTLLRRGGAAIKNILKGISSGIGTGFEVGISTIGKIGKVRNWRVRRRDN